ncbi:hypothetical protein PG995_005534 [Apiospora arundinis]
MDKLSAEIILLIIESLGEYAFLAEYAAISRQWQAVVESRTFAHIKYDAHKDLSIFHSAFSQHRRRSILRQLEANFGRCVWGLSDRKSISKQQTYLADATALVRELAGWKEDPGNSYNFEVKVEAWKRMMGREAPAFTDNLLESFSALASTDSIPFVQTLSTHIWPGLARPALATVERFSMLQVLSVEFQDDQYNWHRRRRQDRVDLAESLLGLRTLPCLEELNISFERSDPQNQHFIDQNLEDSDGVDPLCDALRQLGQADGSPLRRLILYNIMISEDLFRNRRLPKSADADTATWPSLTKLDIGVHKVAPSGRWYYTGHSNDEESDSDDEDDEDNEEEEDEEDDDEDEDEEMGSDSSGIMEPGYHGANIDGEGDSSDEQSAKRILAPDAAQRDRPEHYFRKRPDPETFDPLALEFAAAVARGSMPRLQTAKLSMMHGGIGQNVATLWCEEAGRDDPWYSSWFEKRRSDFPEVRRWRYYSEDGLVPWKPNQEILDEWRKWLGKDGLVFEVVERDIKSVTAG